MTAYQKKKSDSRDTVISSSTTALSQDIEDLHYAACCAGEKIYIDPNTGLSCWTEVAHLQRGVCCGRKCRHCPYGWENVGGSSRPAKLASKDKNAAKKLLNDVLGAKGTEGPKESVNKGETGGSHGGTLTSKNVPYTRSGDKGKSRLPSGQFRSKNDSVFEAMGTVDELCSVVGVCHSLLIADPFTEREQELHVQLVDVMSRLFDIGSQIAAESSTNEFFNEEDSVQKLELWIDGMTEQLPELTSFILPTGSVIAAQFHVARTVCRRAERLYPSRYLNRLSDFLFTAARFVNHNRKQPEVLYRKVDDAAGKSRQVQTRETHQS